MGVFFKACIALIFVTLNIGYGQGDPRVCYYCDGSESDKELCNDPVNTTALKIDDCNALQDGLYKGSMFKMDFAKAGGSATCIKASAIANGNRTTMRSCVYKTVDDKEVCAFLKSEVQNVTSITGFTCSTCNSNLCNSGTSMYASIIFFTIVSFAGFML